MMTAPDGERLARLEAENEAIRKDILEIKDFLKAQTVTLQGLKDIAARGGGALHAILMLGGLIGWIVGIGTTIFAIVHTR
jgi:hypothetical protein